ncbi:hypothetical protein FBQ82_20615 [Anaerolineae bacterium CFX7]|nr:hypothetical protein [Anaerolineae bacterium CFX7]
MNELPEIVFSNWKLWSERARFDHLGEPGVYILARFEKSPREKANPLSKQVIYIGETCDQTLKQRWQQFHRAAFLGKHGHSGGASYRAIFADDGKSLYAAIFPLGRATPPLQSLLIRHVERKLILDYALKWGKPPICNSK